MASGLKRQNPRTGESARETAAETFDDDEFNRWVGLLERRTGMYFTMDRKSFLQSSLLMRMHQLNCGSFDEYYERLNDGLRGATEWAALIDRLTVHETRFMRHPSSYQLLIDRFLPWWLARHTPPRSLRVWSVACATGEEPYTLAMVLDRRLRDEGHPSYLAVTATDISMPALAEARRGIYKESKIGQVPGHLRSSYFLDIGKGRYQVCDSLRDRVCFMQMNVLELTNAPLGMMDIIYCQNLLIYFDRQQRHRIVANLARFLDSGGWLVLGPGEIMEWDRSVLTKVSDENTLALAKA